MSNAEFPQIRPRSPGYPAIDLQQARGKARLLFRAEQQRPVSFSTVMKTWGYSPKSGPGRLAFAAAKSFGLIQCSGHGSTKTAWVSDAAVKIFDYGSDSDEHLVSLVRNAALRPKIHRLLWDAYGAALPQGFLELLQSKHGFTEPGASHFQLQYLRTLVFAELEAPTQFRPSSREDDGDADVPHGQSDRQLASSPTSPSVRHGRQEVAKKWSPHQDGIHLSFPLSNGNVLELRLQDKVSAKELEKIRAILDLALDSFRVQEESTA